MKYILIIILVSMSAFFSATEVAVSTANKIRMKHLASLGDKKAVRALNLLTNYDKVLTTILIGNNVANIFAASWGTVIFTSIFGASGVAISAVVLTIVLLIFGEILPKTLAKENADRILLFTSIILVVLTKLFTPVNILFVKLKSGISKILGTDKEAVMSEQELRSLIQDVEAEGVISERERILIDSALTLDDISVSQIMIPRTQVLAININTDLAEIKQLFLTEKYSRIPVYEDTIDNILGVLYEKDFFSFLERVKNQNKETCESLLSLLHNPVFLLESKSVSAALLSMQTAQVLMAIVKDIHGGTSGVLTLEDILEELVGEIYDESDIAYKIIKNEDETYTFPASVTMHDISCYFDISCIALKELRLSVASWITERLNAVPVENDFVETDNFVITVNVVKQQSIKYVTFKLKTGGSLNNEAVG